MRIALLLLGKNLKTFEGQKRILTGLLSEEK